jgi:hypothetical protein
MMFYDPIQEVVKSKLVFPIARIESIVKPNIGLGFRLIKRPNQNINTQGNVLFIITVTCRITYSKESYYDSEFRSVTEIVKSPNPLVVLELQMVYDSEIKKLEKMLNDDIVNKQIKMNGNVEVNFPAQQIESDIQIELDSFLSEEKD